MFGVMTCLLIGECGCNTTTKQTPVPLSFSTIEQQDHPHTSQPYSGDDIQIVVISNTEEISELGGWVSDAVKHQLEKLDYAKVFVLAGFQGGKPTDGYGIEFISLERLENVVKIELELISPDPDTMRLDTETFPYHIIQITKDGNWGETITFNVFHNEEIVALFSHHIP